MKKILMVLLFSQLGLWAQTQQKYHRATITYKTVANLKKLENAGIPMDHGKHKAGYSLTSDFSDSELQAARNLGIPVTVEIEDVQHYYEAQNSVKKITTANPENASCGTSAIAYTTPFNFEPGSMAGYYTYAEMLQQLDNMRALRPDLISEKTGIGTYVTAEGRTLQWVKITKNPESINTRPQVLYTAVHHAREPISLSETIFYMWYLLENYDTNAEVKYLVDNTEMYFVPVVNPDGYIYNQTTNPAGFGMWRKNRHNFGANFGVDNNRNYDYWIGGDPNQSVWNTTGISPNASGETYPGTAPFSEPETQAINYFVENHNFKLALNSHTYSDLLLYPFGYELNSPGPDNDYYKTISHLMVSNNDLTNEISSELYAASGDSDDFMYGQMMGHNKIFAFTPEIGQSFWPASGDIVPLSSKMMFTNLAVAKLALNYAELTDKSPQFLGNTAVVNASFEIQRLGLGGNGNFTVSVNPISANIVGVGTPQQIDNMAVSDIISSTIPLQIAAGTTSNDLLVFEYLIDNGSYIEHQLVTKRFGQTLLVVNDPASAVAPAWNGPNWGTTTEAFVSPTTSITDSPFSSYANNQTKDIRFANPINLTNVSGATVNFNAKWELEGNYDYVTFDVSTDNGVTWISQCGKYTKLVNGVPTYTGFHDSWINEEIDLNDYAGQTIRVRFRLVSDEGVTYDGFYFDDFKVNTLQNSVLSTSIAQFSPFRIYPNPVRSTLNIETSKNNYSIAIFNALGQTVLSKESNDGLQQLDLSGLASGVYVIKLHSTEFSDSQKFVKD